MKSKVYIECFVEDHAHERFVKAIVEREAVSLGFEKGDLDISCDIAQGSRVWNELREYLKVLRNARATPDIYPDMLIVVIDGNCKGTNKVRKDVEKLIRNYGLDGLFHLVVAVPDPYIERWFLEDEEALKRVLPGSQVPPIGGKKRCDKKSKTWYKDRLKQWVKSAGVEPILGGIEYSEDIAYAIDYNVMDESFKKFHRDLINALKMLKR